MKRNLLTLVLALIATCSMAQTKEDPAPVKDDDGQDLIDTFFDLYKNRGYEVALKYSWSTNKWIPATGDAMNNIAVRLGKQVASMGEFIGQEQLKSRKVGSRFRIASYLVYYQRDPMRFTFELYKNNDGWEITDVEFDTKFDEEVEESMRLTNWGGTYR